MKIRPRKERVETREDDGQAPVLSGYAAVFYNPDDAGTEYQVGPTSRYRERIAPSAFDRALLEGHDVRGLFNHDTATVLARTSSGSLRLSVDDIGLRYEMDEDPSDPDWQKVAAKVRRGDVDGSSFMFEILSETRTEDEENDLVIYTITDVKLYDVGPVSFPAFESATAEMRSDPRFRDPPKNREAERIAIRMRALELGNICQTG